MCLHWKPLYLRQLHSTCQARNEPHPASPVPKCPRCFSRNPILQSRLWVKREAGCVVQRQRDRGIEMRGRTLKKKQINNTDLMTEIETVAYFRDLLSGWWMVWNSLTVTGQKNEAAFSGLLGQDLSCTSLQMSVEHVCAHVHVCVYTHIIHTHTKCLAQKVTYKPGQLTDRTCMSKASMNTFGCCRYVLLAYNFSLKQNCKHELQAVEEITCIKET